MAAIIAQAIATSETQKLRAIIAADDFDLLGGLKMKATARHKAYVERDAYLKALKKLRRKMGWPEAAA